MKIIRTYETTIMSNDSEHAVQVLAVPKRSIPPNASLEPKDLFEELNLGKVCAVDASNLVHYLAVLASPELPQTELPEALATAVKAPTYEPTKDDVRFAELISFDRLIPFEESPLELESLAKLAATPERSSPVRRLRRFWSQSASVDSVTRRNSALRSRSRHRPRT